MPGDGDRAGRGERGRVVHEVDEHPAEAERIAGDEEGGTIWASKRSSRFVSAARGGEQTQDFVGGFGRGERQALEDEAALLNFRKVGTIVDQGAEPGAFGGDRAEIAALGPVQARFSGQIGEAHVGVERGADRVARHGEKIPLGPFGGGGRGLGFLQCAFGVGVRTDLGAHQRQQRGARQEDADEKGGAAEGDRARGGQGGPGRAGREVQDAGEPFCEHVAADGEQRDEGARGGGEFLGGAPVSDQGPAHARRGRTRRGGRGESF